MASNLSVTKKAQELQQLTQEIRKGVITSQMINYAVAKELSRIKREKLYRYWDSNRKVTWNEWVANSDIPLSVDLADKWIRIYDHFVLTLGYEAKDLSEIDYNKLLLIAPRAKSRDVAEDLLDQAKNLSVSDLRSELKGETCIHPSVEQIKIVAYKCNGCGMTWAKDPSQERERRIADGQTRDELVSFLKNTLELDKLDGSYKENRDYSRRCLNKFGEEDTRKIIVFVANSEYWSDKVTCMKNIYNHGVRILKQNNKDDEDVEVPEYAK